MLLRSVFWVAILAVASAPFAYGGRILVANDDYTLDTSVGFSADAGVFVDNVFGSFFGLETGDKILIYTPHYSGNPLDGTALNAALTGIVGAGNVVTSTDPSLVSSPNGLSAAGYQAVIVGGFPRVSDTALLANLNAALIDFVESGNNVYLFGGSAQMFDTSLGCLPGDTEEECKMKMYSPEGRAWDAFLNTFGLDMEYNPPAARNIGYYDTTPFQSYGDLGSTIFGGVSTLYEYNDNQVSKIGSPDFVLMSSLYSGSAGLFAAIDAAPGPFPETVPEPVTFVLVGMGLMAVGVVRRYKRR